MVMHGHTADENSEQIILFQTSLPRIKTNVSNPDQPELGQDRLFASKNSYSDSKRTFPLEGNLSLPPPTQRNNRSFPEGVFFFFFEKGRNSIPFVAPKVLIII